MRFFCKQFFKTPMFLVFAVMIVLYGFSALAKPAEINQYAVVTALGIDKAENSDNGEGTSTGGADSVAFGGNILSDVESAQDEQLYEVTLLTFIPVAQQNFTEKYKVVNGKGRSVSEAIDLAALNIGREIGLSHLKIIVLSHELVETGLFKFLDYLLRNIQISSSTKVVATDEPAKEFLEAAQKLDNESSIKVAEHIMFNSDYIYSTESSLETFFKGTFGPTHVGLMACLSAKGKEEQTTPTASSGDGGSSDGGGQAQSSPDEMITQCHVYVFKEENLVTKLGERDMKRVNFVIGDYNNGSLVVENFSDDHFQDANLTFEIFDKSIGYKIVYQNGIPVVNIDTSLTLRLSEVEQNTGILQENVELFVITPQAIKAVEKKVKTSMAEGLNIMRENQSDIADFYTILHNDNRIAFHNFLDSLENPDDYLDRIVFKLSVRIYAK